MSKVAIIILADTAGPGDFGRAVNGLMTAKEFDGAGTKWISKFTEEGGKYNDLFDSVKDKVAGVCGYCAGAFGVTKDAEACSVDQLNEYNGHPSFKKLVDEGFTIITF